MKTGNYLTIINFALSILQLGSLLAAGLLHYFSDKKMGAMRHLVYKNRQFASGIFSPEFLQVYKTIVIVGMVFTCLLLCYSYFKDKQFVPKKSLVHLLLLQVVTLVTLYINGLLITKAYYYILIALFSVVLIQTLKLFIVITAMRIR